MKLEDKIRFERFIELAGDKTGRLLDLGCGDGAFASIVGDRFEYHGIEIVPEKVKAAWERELNVIQHDLNEGIPYPDKTFRVVTAGEFIEHVLNLSDFLTEVRRVMKDDGVFIGSTPNVANPSYYIRLVTDTHDYGEHVCIFGRMSLATLFKMNDLKITEFTSSSFLPVSKFTLRLNKWLGRKLSRLGYFLIFKAEKAGGKDENVHV